MYCGVFVWILIGPCNSFFFSSLFLNMLHVVLEAFLPVDAIWFQGEHDKKYDHDAFLGKDTAAEYDDLTPEKSKERLA